MGSVLNNTVRNMRRGPYQAIGALMVLTLTFFIAQSFALLTHASQEIMSYFETRPQITAFFYDETTQVEIDELRHDLLARNLASETTFVSKEDALEIYRLQNADDPLLLEMVTADILPASIEVQAIDIDALPHIFELLKDSPIIEEVSYEQDVVEILRRWTRGMRLIGTGLVAYLAITTIIILIIIITMKVAVKRQEIAVMRLLGASSWYIRGPFVFEAAFYGIVSAIFGWLGMYAGLYYSVPYITVFLGEIPLLPIANHVFFGILLVSCAAGMFMGMVSSFIATRRFYR